MNKSYVIKCTCSVSEREYFSEGTLEELIEHHSYTLMVGKSYQHEKGNKKINTCPKTVKSLVTQLNNAVANSAANGCPSKHYELV